MKPMKDRTMNILQIVTFLVTAGTSIPLFVSYLRDVEPAFALFVHLHVWVGLAFILISLMRMALRKKIDMQRSTVDNKHGM